MPTSKARCRGAERSGPDQKTPTATPKLELLFSLHLGTQNFDEVEFMLQAFQASWIFSKKNDYGVCNEVLSTDS